MFGSIGGPELIVIFLVALLIFGPRKLPELGKMLGKGMGEFRRAANDLRVSLETEVARETPARRDVAGAGTAVASLTPAGDSDARSGSGPVTVPAPGAHPRAAGDPVPGAEPGETPAPTTAPDASDPAGTR